MVNKLSKGTCLFCNEKFGKRAIKTHFNKCKLKQELDSKNLVNSENEKTFLILVEAKYNTNFWIYIEADEKITLSKIDELLRDVWLECCGHLSAFYIGRNNEIAKSKKLSSFMKEGLELEYEYDFGSTTELKLKVISEREGSLGKRKIRLNAINDLPEIKCSFCENEAKFICPFCYEEEMCAKHVLKHSCAKTEGEDMMMPVVNSPRMGECGYSGSDEDIVKKIYYPQK